MVNLLLHPASSLLLFTLMWNRAMNLLSGAGMNLEVSSVLHLDPQPGVVRSGAVIHRAVIAFILVSAFLRKPLKKLSCCVPEP